MTTGREGFFFLSCDALTLSVALPATVAAIGLLAAAWIGSGWSVPGRFGACLAVGVMTLALAFAFGRRRYNGHAKGGDDDESRQ